MKFLFILVSLFATTHLHAECSASDVAVLDSGVDLNHRDLRPHLLPGYDSADQDSNPQDDLFVTQDGVGDVSGHGTQVTGLVLGAGHSTLRAVQSINCYVRAMPLKVQKSQQTYSEWIETDGFSAKAVVDAFRRALNNPSIKVVNASFGLGAESFDQDLIYLLERAKNQGVFVVVAAGNEDWDLDSIFAGIKKTPRLKLCKKGCKARRYSGSALRKLILARYPNFVLVGNADNRTKFVDNGQKLFTSTNFGRTTVLFATNGENIWTTNTGGEYTNEASGSSFSAPRISRALALLKARYPKDSFQQILNRLRGAVVPSTNLSGKFITNGYLP